MELDSIVSLPLTVLFAKLKVEELTWVSQSNVTFFQMKMQVRTDYFPSCDHFTSRHMLSPLYPVTVGCFSWSQSTILLIGVLFLSDPSPIIGYACHSLPNSLTHSLTHCCLANLIDVNLACEDANSKLVEVVTVADVDAEHKDWSRFWSWSSGIILKLEFVQHFVADVL